MKICSIATRFLQLTRSFRLFQKCELEYDDDFKQKFPENADLGKMEDLQLEIRALDHITKECENNHRS